MTNTEYEAYLKQMVRSFEEFCISYAKMLEGVFRDRDVFPPQDEFTIWYKQHLREEKNLCDKLLKEFREELTYYRQGLNPPYCYPDYWKDKNI